MDYVRDSIVWVSHIISIDKVDQGNVPLLWNMYGYLIPIAFPYSG